MTFAAAVSLWPQLQADPQSFLGPNLCMCVCVCVWQDLTVIKLCFLLVSKSKGEKFMKAFRTWEPNPVYLFFKSLLAQQLRDLSQRFYFFCGEKLFSFWPARDFGPTSVLI